MCDCQSYNGGFGSTPEVVMPFGKYFPHTKKQSVSIDKCIAEAIESLWKAGIETGGCCCGHNGKSKIANGMPSVMIIEPSDARKTFDILKSDERQWWVMFWAGSH